VGEKGVGALGNRMNGQKISRGDGINDPTKGAKNDIIEGGTG